MCAKALIVSRLNEKKNTIKPCLYFDLKKFQELYKDDELYTQKIGFHNNAALTVGQTYKNGRIVEGVSDKIKQKN